MTTSVPSEKRPRVALVVGSGGLKCVAALGLWRVLAREGVEVDLFVGCSGGSIYVSAMAFGFPLEESIKRSYDLWSDRFRRKNFRAILQIIAPRLFSFNEDFGLVDDRGVNAALEDAFGDRRIEQAARPLFIVATDFPTGERVVLESGRLADAVPAIGGWEIAARFESAKQVAGDFYDAFPLEGGLTMIVVADVCGKGVGAALYVALFRSLLRSVATAMPADASPSSVLDRAARVTNDYIATTHESSSMFATAFLGVIDHAGSELHYINCGHEAPLVVSCGAVRARLAPTGPALGLMPGLPFTVSSEAIAPGETVVLFTDGVTEASGAAGFFGDERLVEVLRSPAESASALLGTIVTAVHAHATGFEPSDDITLLAIRRE